MDDEDIVHFDALEMLKVTRLTTALSAAALSVLGFSGLAYADVKLIEIGRDTVGIPAFLDLTTIQGSNYKMFQQYGSGISEISMSVSCAQGRMFVTRLAIYNAEGHKIVEDRQRKEVSPAPGSVGAKSMQFVCHRIGALGW